MVSEAFYRFRGGFIHLCYKMEKRRVNVLLEFRERERWGDSNR